MESDNFSKSCRGLKEKNKHASKKLHQGRGGVGKAIVVGAKQRGGMVVAKHVQDTTAGTLHGFIGANVAKGNEVYWTSPTTTDS